MSTLEKTVDALSKMSEPELQKVYNFVITIKSEKHDRRSPEEIEAALSRLTGIVPDEGMSLEDYRNERLSKRYGLSD